MAEKEEDISSLINHFESTTLGDKSDSGILPWKPLNFDSIYPHG